MSWAFLDDRANEHDKQTEIGGAASWYWACGLMYCRRKERERRAKGVRVDFIPFAASLTLFADPKAKDHVKEIVRVKLWEVTEGGYIVHDYHDVYGHQRETESDPAATSSDQQSQLTAAQLAARRAGGKARAAQASRGPAARFQQSASKEPASRASGSGSGSYSGSNLTQNVVAEDLAAETREPHEPTTTGQDVFSRSKALPSAAGEPPNPRKDPICERIPFSRWAPSQGLLDWAKAAGLVDRDIDATLIEMQNALTGRNDLAWWDLKAVRFFEVTIQRKKPPKTRSGLRVGQTDPDWPTDRDLAMRARIHGGEWGDELRKELEDGKLDASLARRRIGEINARNGRRAASGPSVEALATNLAKQLGGDR